MSMCDRRQGLSRTELRNVSVLRTLTPFQALAAKHAPLVRPCMDEVVLPLRPVCMHRKSRGPATFYRWPFGGHFSIPVPGRWPIDEICLQTNQQCHARYAWSKNTPTRYSRLSLFPRTRQKARHGEPDCQPRSASPFSEPRASPSQLLSPVPTKTQNIKACIYHLPTLVT